MMAKIMIEKGYRYGSGLGRYEEGVTQLPDFLENKDRFGLGYKPTKEDKRRIAAERKEKRLARLEKREPRTGKVPLCDIRQSFRSGGIMFADQIAAVGDDLEVHADDGLVYQCSPGTELGNWEAVEFPVIFDALTK